MKIRDLIKARTTAGLRRAGWAFLSELAIQRRHRSSLKRSKHFSNRSHLRLNVGCGSGIKLGWINVDLWANEADLHLDLRESFPFRDESVSFIYSEHFFEHLEYPDQTSKFL